MSTAPHVHTLAAPEPRPRRVAASAVALLADSFAAEPNFVELFPDPAVRARALPHVFTGLWRDAAQHGRIDLAWHNNDIVGVAVWFKPWAYPPTAARQVRLLPSALAIARAAPSAVTKVARFNHRLTALHPRQPYTYLAAVGVTPASQGRGVGSVLLRAGLRWTDEERVPAYLEAQRPATAAWYERHGFVIRWSGPVLSDGPNNWGMWHSPTNGVGRSASPGDSPLTGGT